MKQIRAAAITFRPEGDPRVAAAILGLQAELLERRFRSLQNTSPDCAAALHASTRPELLQRPLASFDLVEALLTKLEVSAQPKTRGRVTQRLEARPLDDATPPSEREQVELAHTSTSICSKPIATDGYERVV
eukprot:CAMPEP_0117469946 /NCGR_PEP_ID=MMETSP0784-20121206/6959_1 /TAXON_ID=39447 /ORGANISM="" /LENGTH=131 /DNA_ID=CAMNT_0005264013 /DNA_START=296 /DNA_END=690 /DNA_ORIENTATION=+